MSFNRFDWNNPSMSREQLQRIIAGVALGLVVIVVAVSFVRRPFQAVDDPTSSGEDPSQYGEYSVEVLKREGVPATGIAVALTEFMQETVGSEEDRGFRSQTTDASGKVRFGFINVGSYEVTLYNAAGYVVGYTDTPRTIFIEGGDRLTGTINLSYADSGEPPNAPTGLRSLLQANGREVDHEWTDASNNENGFALEQARDEVFTAPLTMNISASSGTGGLVRKTDTLPPNASGDYFYRVKAWRIYDGAELFSAPSNTMRITVVPRSEKPNAPRDLSVKIDTTNLVTLTFLSQSGNEDGFRIYRTSPQTGEYERLNIPVPQGTLGQLQSVDDPTLSPYDTNQYSYKLVAYRVVNGTDYESNFSNVVTVQTKVTTVTVAQPTRLVAGEVRPRRIEMSWRDNADNEDGYDIERAIGDTSSFVSHATVAKDIRRFNDTELQKNTIHRYRVRGFKNVRNFKIYSEYSPTLRVRTR